MLWDAVERGTDGLEGGEGEVYGLCLIPLVFVKPAEGRSEREDEVPEEDAKGTNE